jgi:hypothetical protein
MMFAYAQLSGAVCAATPQRAHGVMFTNDDMAQKATTGFGQWLV